MSGIEKSDLYPDVQLYTPMLVGKCPDDVEQLVAKKGWLASIKKDGYWEVLVKENNQVYMFARSKSKKTGFYTEKISHVPHLEQWMRECVPNGTMIIGEIYLPGGTSKDVTTILGCLPEKAIARQMAGEKLHFWAYDLLKYDGKDYVQEELAYGRRFSNLCKYIDLSANLIPEVEVVDILDSVYCDILDVAERLINEGEEGLVVRLESGLYLPGKRRPREMFKIKQHEDSVDLVITGIEDPEIIYTGKEINSWPYWSNLLEPEHKVYDPTMQNKQYLDDGIANLYSPVTKAYFNGWKNAFTLGAYCSNDGLTKLVDVGRVASGLTDELREDCAKNPDKYLGQVVEVECMSLDKQEHSLRHPVFVRMRPDKSPYDCKIEEIFK